MMRHQFGLRRIITVAMAMALFSGVAFQISVAVNNHATQTQASVASISESPQPENQPQVSLEQFSYSQLQMAMPMRITVWTDSQSRAQAACKLAFARAAELVNVFSNYDRDSEINRLLRSETGTPHKVSRDLLDVLLFSKRLHQQSSCGFNPTAGPVIQLWRQARKSGELPDKNTIDLALSKSGFDKLVINKEACRVTILDKNVSLDFGAIAKGYIGDRVIKLLSDNGIKNACYEAGGDFVLGDPPPETDGWTIDIGNQSDGRPNTKTLANCAISTSGDANQFVEVSGKRYSHVVDPRTGIGVTSGTTAFVIAPSGMYSDALATTGCILNQTEFENLLLHFEETKGWRETRNNFDQRNIESRSSTKQLITTNNRN